jgi:hypothetical protein
MRNGKTPYTEPYGVLADHDQVLEIIGRLDKFETCKEAREFLLSIVESGEIDIRPVGTYLDIRHAKLMSPKALIDDIVTFTAGARLNSQAIRGVAL